MLNPASFLLRKESASLAALVAHALGAWQEHRVLVESEQVSLCLARNDLYARQALRALPSRSQLDLSRWAEAHLLLSALVRDPSAPHHCLLLTNDYLSLTTYSSGA